MVMAGMEDIVAATSSICDVNGKEGRLIYRGYDIHDLAEHSTFEEVAYLLWFGRLPKKSELETLTKELGNNRSIPPGVVDLMKKFPHNATPMEVLRTAVSALSMYDPDGQNDNHEANLRKAIRLTAQTPTIIAYWDNIRKNKPTLAPDANLSLAANFLYLLSGKKPDELSTKSLDIAL